MDRFESNDVRSFDVRSRGASGDGRTLDQAAIQRTLDDCAASGGGTVRFPPGRYLSGTLRLRSDVTLFLEAGAVLQATTDLSLYPDAWANSSL